MAAVAVTIPRMLADLVAGERRFEVQAETVDGVLGEVVNRHPELAVHLFDESGALRAHVSCFHNDTPAERTAPVIEGDRIVILQAVSGGSPIERHVPAAVSKTTSV
jgi:hypothetical protein